MRRLARHLFTFCSALSLLLCVAACVMWVRSYRVGERAQLWSWSGGVGGGVSYHAVTSDKGQVSYKYSREPGGAKPRAGTPRFRQARWDPSPEDYPPDPEAPAWGGFHWQRGNGVYSGPFTLVGLPYWFVAGAKGVLPLYWLVRRAPRRRRATSGRCRSCGYDLRASPDRCPECGVPAVGPSRGNGSGDGG